MPKVSWMRTTGLYLACVLFLMSMLVLFNPSVTPVMADNPSQKTEEYCLSCHNQPSLSMTLPDGERLSLYISPEVLSQSMHSPAGIECEACHTGIKTYPHPILEFDSKRDLSLSYYQACQKCHPTNYTKTMDSIHAQVAEAGNTNAPICTDCHGAHDVKHPNQPRSLISTTCGKCHSSILNEYKISVHGGALIQEDNPDVPVCTDCHGVHNIQDPRTSQFRVDTPDLCAGCHAEADLMGKYGLSTEVYHLYKTSWHGVDVSIYKTKWPTIWHESAVCTDCHGVHNIRKTEDSTSSVNPKNLLTTCQQCHQGAGSNWTGAWTGHNRIDQKRTPILYYTSAFYSSFIPILLWSSAIYVILQIIHALVDRVRRSLP